MKLKNLLLSLDYKLNHLFGHSWHIGSGERNKTTYIWHATCEYCPQTQITAVPLSPQDINNSHIDPFAYFPAIPSRELDFAIFSLLFLLGLIAVLIQYLPLT